MIIPISVHSRCLRRRNVRDHRKSCAESLDRLYNHIRIGACVHLRYATRALIGKKKLANSNYGGENIRRRVCYRHGNGEQLSTPAGRKGDTLLPWTVAARAAGWPFEM